MSTQRFNPLALDEAYKLKLTDEVFRDRSPVWGVTIDPQDAKELDDAIWLSTDYDTYFLSVSVADVSALVRPDSYIDQEAYQRAFTRYGKRGSNPMLPRILAEKILSLIEGEPRPTLTVSVPIDRQTLRSGEPNIERTYVESTQKFTYEEADALIGETASAMGQMLSHCATLGTQLLNQRRANGAFAFFDLEQGWATSEEGQFQPLKKSLAYHSHVMIQECIILANKAFAEFQAAKGIPGLFRNHQATPQAPDRGTLLEQLEQVHAYPEHFDIETVRERFAIVMKKAEYSTQIVGHYGLNLPVYGHYSSGLRRYPDIPNQANINAFLQSSPLPYSLDSLQQIADHVNTVENQLRKERAAYLQEKAYKEAKRTFVNPETTYRSMDDKQFHHIITVAAKEGLLSEQLVESITERMASQQLHPRDIFRILFQVPEAEKSTWQEVQGEIMGYLSSKPAHAVSLLKMAADKLGWQVGETQYAIGEQINGFQATLSAVVDDRQFSAQSTAQSKKGSAQDVAFQLLCQIIGLEPTKFPEPRASTDSTDVEFDMPKYFVPGTNYVGNLVEYCQEGKWKMPIYEIEQSGASHQPLFTGEAIIHVNGTEYRSGMVSAKTKKQARQLAAAQLLENLPTSGGKAPLDTQTTSADSADSPSLEDIAEYDPAVNYVGLLQTTCQQRRWGLPTYGDWTRSGSKHAPIFTCTCTIEIGGREYSSGAIKGNSKREAKKRSAAALLQKLPSPEEIEPMVQSTVGSILSDTGELEFNPDVNYIGILNDIRQQYQWPMAEYLIFQSGPSHAPIHRVVLNFELKKRLYESDPVQAPGLKVAKQMAAANLLQKLEKAGVIPR